MLTREILIDLDDRERKEAAAARRFPVSVSSETPVRRRSWDGDWQEILSHARDAIDLSRAPLPVLEGHDRSRVNVGIVSNLRVDGTRLRGELVLGSSARARELAADIADGIVTGLSVGYTVDREERDEKTKRITARRWTPYEVSIVSIPADVTVGIGRSHTMDPQNPSNPQPPAPPADPLARAAPPSPEVLAERQRVDTIRSLVARQDLGEELASALVERGVPLDRAREIILDRLAARSDSLPPHPNATHEAAASEQQMRGFSSPLTPGDDRAQDFHRAAVDSILLRSGIPVPKPHAAARDVSASVHDLARVCLSRAGKSASRWFGGGEARGPDLIKRAMTTSDFPLILSGALHASVRQGYEVEPSTHRVWVRTTTVPDFRDQERPILGSAPGLEKVLEHGEYRQGPMTEDTTRYRVEKYGKIVGLTWEVLVNDNLQAFLRVQPALGQAARRKEADVVYALLAENAGAGPTMQDGTALFHTDHGNLAGAASVNPDQLAVGRKLLRRQTAVGGGYLALVPRFWIVPPEAETTAETILANASRRMTAEKTTAEWIANLELVVEPRLPDTAQYLAADSSQIDTVEMGLLEENGGGPVIEEEREFIKDGFQWKVRHVFGAKALDFRGLVKLPIGGG